MFINHGPLALAKEKAFMPQNTPVFTVAREWDFLEPAINPNYARTDHIKLKPAGAGLTITYAQGQAVAQKDDGSNEFAKLGTAGYTGAKRLIKYTVTLDENGYWQYGTVFYVNTGTVDAERFEGTVAAYYRGYFKTQDLVGVADDDALATVGRLHRGTRTAGIVALNEAAPVAPAA
jgi:hypothetical protein